MDNKVKNKRLASLDVLKFMSMLGVICLHVNMNYKDNIVAEFLYMTAVFAIPTFFAVSGYLLIGKDVNWNYVIKKILGIVKFVVIINVLYWLLHDAIIGHNLDFYLLLNDCFGSFVQKGRVFWLFWYFGSMILLYALLIPINKLIQRVGFIKCLIVCGVICFCFQINNIYHPDNVPIEETFLQPFRLWLWVFYFILGGYLRNVSTSISQKQLLLITITLLTINFLTQKQLELLWNQNFIPCELFYGSPLTIALVVSLFLVIRKCNIETNRVTALMSLVFLPVYTIHLFIIIAVTKLFSLFNLDVMEPLFVTLGAATISILLSIILMNLPYVNKIFKI